MHSVTESNGRLTLDSVSTAAQADGLIKLGDARTSLATILKRVSSKKVADGHLVALLMSTEKRSIGWKGDFHFVRCDDPSGCVWSQKNGPDQVTNFDFAGHPISDPSHAGWTVNQGPVHLGGKTAKQTLYVFGVWMFVPFGKVSII
jgi:hypothetical protein